MRILIVSNSPWRSDNSFGNSFSNIFEGIPDLEIANIYCKYGKPQTKAATRFFQITEKSILKSILKHTPSGQEVFQEDEAEAPADRDETAFNKIKRHKSIPMYWARAMIWKTGKWKSQALLDFLDDFKPDLLFIPVYYSHYLHDINRFILKRYGIPAVGYVSDDVYTLKQFSLSPFFWIDRLILRPKMKKVFSWCKTVYVISETQRREYAAIFGDKFKVLTKCASFADENKPAFKVPEMPLKLVYAGNVSAGRGKILCALAESVRTLNDKENTFTLDIYTSTPLGDKVKDTLNGGGVALHPPVSYAKIREIQADADILVHAEAFDLKERLSVHQSFSTKIVDYIASNRCILAIGSDTCASIQYFIENDCAAVATAPSEISERLSELKDTPALLAEYAEKAWQSGKAHHERSVMQENLLADLKNAIGE